MAEKTIPAARREARDASGTFILGAFLVLVSGVSAVGLLCWWIFPRAPYPDLMLHPVPTYPSPQLQADPHQDWVRFHRAELERLNSVGWVNKAQGIVHVPIEQAMRKLAAQGIPGWPTSGQTSGGGQQ